MTRCDYDAVFYRVFCVTLLAIAFTFTVILTNVFIDIDGLLASKKEKHNIHMSDKIIRDEFTSEATDNYEINYGENEDSYRTKRSTETKSFLFHIKNPKVKNILANRLSTLLEELDAEESMNNKYKEKKIIVDARKDAQAIDARKDAQAIDARKDAQAIDAPKLSEDEKRKKAEDMLHLTMHNILLQGIIGHMDLNDVYKRIYTLMSNFNEIHDKKGGMRTKPDEVEKDGDQTKLLPKPIEDKFFDEMLNCNELKDQINRATTTEKGATKKPNKIKGPPGMIIKTIIDITSAGNDKTKVNETKTSENIKGIIELIYNGKVIKFARPEADVSTPPPSPPPLPKKIPIIIKPKKAVKSKIRMPETTTATVTYDINSIPKSYMDKFIEEYFKRFPRVNKVNNEIDEQYETKRLKRHIKIKYDNKDLQDHKKKRKKQPEDDELYVEIETHFDSKGMKGEKKKKLIRNLIEKIQKAIHSNMDIKTEIDTGFNSKKRKKLHFKKRLQDPLKHSNHVLVNKFTIPLSSIVHRQLNPISKTVEESSPNIGLNNGEDWKKPCYGPGFLTSTKSINSAEMSEVDVDYNKVLGLNGIPQRLQLPLNTELSEETFNTNSYYDVGKMKFFIKDIDGSGFSVGFNQYVDEAPDSETMRLFTGLENVIKTYHQTYDPANEPVSTTEAILNSDFNEREFDSLPPNDEHVIERRSIKNKDDYHSNEYRMIFDHNYMPYNNYREIFETNNLGTNKIAFSSKKHYKELPLVVDENIFEKNLKPAEIFGLANLFERKKRSMNVKKISNLNSKIKLNRYLNTKAMSTKRIFLNKKRNKRQINKIRIIATDLPHISKNSDENVFVVSDENVFADRAIVKDVETSEADHDKQDDTDYIPFQSDDSMPSTYVTKIFDGRSRHNPLMSKYPHIFMEEISRSREEYLPNNALLFGKIPGLSKFNHNLDAEKTDEKFEVEHVTTATNDTESTNILKEQDIVNALMAPSPTKSNYKVTVKIIPKNQTGLNSGFKEIHTSINKRFNKNGLLYSSLVNVSEISNVVKLNRSKDTHGDVEYKGVDSFMSKKIKDQQERMQYLLKQHAKHINEQLNRLRAEKTNLESLIDSDNVTDLKYIDYDDLYSNLKKLTPGKEEVTVTQLDIKPTVTTQKPKSTERITVTTVLTTTQPPHNTLASPMLSERIKKNLITTIERNGNLTDQILKKIDHNTEILQAFLKKLTEKIHLIPTPEPVTEQITDPTQKPVNKIEENNFPPNWNNQPIPFNHNMVIRKNDSHISIPFVYAYQQPILPHKNNIPVANVVYHGHIHTNAIHAKDQNHIEKDNHKMGNKIQESNNQSRFFIDELENDYKVIQVGDVKKNREYNMVNVNGTMS